MRRVPVLPDEREVAQVEDLHLSMPTDPRLRRIVDEMTAFPANRRTLASWAPHAGMSVRTPLLLISRYTATSFGRWRQQFDMRWP